MNANTWSQPFHGVQHFGRGQGTHRLTVQNLGSCAKLLRWFPGCGFAPMESTHQSVDEARTAGEKWLAEIAA